MAGEERGGGIGADRRNAVGASGPLLLRPRGLPVHPATPSTLSVRILLFPPKSGTSP